MLLIQRRSGDPKAKRAVVMEMANIQCVSNILDPGQSLVWVCCTRRTVEVAVSKEETKYDNERGFVGAMSSTAVRVWSMQMAA